jgi:hypothetical protein
MGAERPSRGNGSVSPTDCATPSPVSGEGAGGEGKICAALLLALVAALTFTSLPSALAQVSVAPEPTVRRIAAPGYTAMLGANGSISSLKVNGVEFLYTGSISRGSYFYQGGVVDMPEISQPAPGVAVASGSVSAVKYEFDDKYMTWTVTNKTNAAMSYFIVLDPAVKAVAGPTGTPIATPTNQTWSKSTFYRENASITVQGGTRLWGPWDANAQVWEAALAPHETRIITLTPASTPKEQQTRITQLTMPQTTPDADITLLSPRDYQVFQRSSLRKGEVRISLRTREPATDIECRFTGSSPLGPMPHAAHIVYETPRKSFNIDATLPAGGWYSLEVHARGRGGQDLGSAHVDHVGVGEVFVVAGQSNSTNYGEAHQTVHSGMVSSFSGDGWAIANDPQLGAADHSTGGSPWPSFGDAMYEHYHVPIGVAVTGYGGTSVNQWQPDGSLFPWMEKRILQLGPQGFRAVLWHQGESDTGMISDEYAIKLTNIIRSSKQQAGWEFPWFVARVSYHSPQEPSFASTRDAQKRLWDEGVALEGPDTDTLTGDNRDTGGKGIHLSAKGLNAHGQMWANSVRAYLDGVLH